MSGIHHKSRSVVLLLSLTAALAVSALSVGCSSSDSDGGTAGESSGAAAGKTGSGDAGDPAVGGSGDVGGAAGETSSAGGASGGSEPTGSAGEAGAPVSEGGSSSGGAATGGTGGAPEDPAITRAKALIAALPLATERCTTCHQDNYAGAGYWANITPDPTNGIGDWSDAEIKAAIVSGIDPDGGTLCATMPHFKFTDAQVADIIIYLRSLKPNTKKITQPCPT